MLGHGGLYHCIVYVVARIQRAALPLLLRSCSCRGFVMEIVHVYTKPRGEFGRQCLFLDRPAELLVDVPPEPSLALQFVQKTPRDQAAQACREMSEHQVS